MRSIPALNPLLLLTFVFASPANDSAATTIVADSVAEFSGEQGRDGWQYGFYDGDLPAPFTPVDFEPFPQFDGERWLIQDGPGSYWTELSAKQAHPNGYTTSGGRLSADHWAVRRWVSDSAGLHSISGVLADFSRFPGSLPTVNGVIGHVIIDGAELLKLPIHDGESTTYSFTANLDVGSTVDFALDARPVSPVSTRTVDFSDWTTFTAQVALIPEPSAAIACTVGLCLAQFALRRTRCQ